MTPHRLLASLRRLPLATRYKGSEEFEAKVEDGTTGQVTARLFAGSQLGNVAVVVERRRLAEFVPEFAMMQRP